jgi:hypothetical protein
MVSWHLGVRKLLTLVLLWCESSAQAHNSIKTPWSESASEINNPIEIIENLILKCTNVIPPPLKYFSI